MNYSELCIDTWNQLDTSGDLIFGYRTCWLGLNDDDKTDLHIFVDEQNRYHLAIIVSDAITKDIKDPHVNGLRIGLCQYRFDDDRVNQVIDLTCHIGGYLEEFTEIVRQIARAILENGDLPDIAVNEVINSWISFWSNQRKEALSEEDQIGLFCELLVLQKMCGINPSNAINAWRGPLGEKHDFNFTDWTVEVKGTRRKKRIHTINGIDQLKRLYNKNFAFVSFMLCVSDGEKSSNLPSLIESIIQDYFREKPNLVVRFNDLLSAYGYSPMHEREYSKFNIEIIESFFYEIDDTFPKIISDMFNETLNPRVLSVRYDISLEGIQGTDFHQIRWGDYCY